MRGHLSRVAQMRIVAKRQNIRDKNHVDSIGIDFLPLPGIDTQEAKELL